MAEGTTGGGHVYKTPTKDEPKEVTKEAAAEHISASTPGDALDPDSDWHEVSSPRGGGGDAGAASSPRDRGAASSPRSPRGSLEPPEEGPKPFQR